MSMNVSGVSGANSVALETGNMSIQMQFAQLQMELAATQKNQAQERIAEIRDSQATSKKYAEAINMLRTIQNLSPKEIGSIPTDPAKIQEELNKARSALDDIKNTIPNSNNNTCVSLSDSTYSLIKELHIDNVRNGNAGAFNSLIATGGVDTSKESGVPDNLHFKRELEPAVAAMENRIKALETYKQVIECGIDPSNLKTSFKDMSEDNIKNVISMLQTKQETSGTDIQQKMVYVQDNMGQYNSYTQGANTAISQANQTLTSLARGN